MTTATAKDFCERLFSAIERYTEVANEIADAKAANPAAFEGWEPFPVTMDSIFIEPTSGSVVNPEALKVALGGEWKTYDGETLISRRRCGFTLWIRVRPRNPR
jgi:hypothetical protein